MSSPRSLVLGAVFGVLALATAVTATGGLETPRGRARVLRCIHDVTPSDAGDPRFDAVLGGRIAPGKWRYYESGYGTTCAVFVTYVLECAGAPAECLNRGPLFKIGAHATRLIDCARARGAYRVGIAGVQPGDIYYVSDTYSNWHVGFWLSAIGSEVVTADGGQTNASGAQCARIVRRVLTRDARGQASLSGPNGFGGARAIRWHIDVSRLFEDGGRV